MAGLRLDITKTQRRGGTMLKGLYNKHSDTFVEFQPHIIRLRITIEIPIANSELKEIERLEYRSPSTRAMRPHLSCQ